MSESRNIRATKGTWQDARDVLDGEAAMVALEDNGHIKTGDFAIVDDDPGIEAAFFSPDAFDDQYIQNDDRYSGGFFFRNTDGFPVELKYRPAEELRDYPELKHVHNVPEIYVAQGEFRMDVATDVSGQNIRYTNIPLENEVFVVPSGLYHGITYQEPGSDLVIARGDSVGDQNIVGKWDEEGNQLYEHATSIELGELAEYEENL